MFFLKYLFLSFRPKHWIKNFFVFIPLVFAGLLFSPIHFVKVVFAFLLFSLLASAIYLINDVLDKEKDKQHPEKSKRPIASGKLNSSFALFFALVLIVLIFWLGLQINLKFVIFLVFYFVLNVVYTLWLKNVLFLDVFSVAFGYVLRVYAGAAAINILVSPWLFLCTILLSLLLSFGKRKHELNLLDLEAGNHREVLKDYNHSLLNQMINFIIALTVICFILYTVAPETVAKFGTYSMIFTTPFVLYGMMRYLYLLNNKKIGSPVEAFLKDKPLLCTVLLWVLLIIAIIYFI